MSHYIKCDNSCDSCKTKTDCPLKTTGKLNVSESPLKKGFEILNAKEEHVCFWIIGRDRYTKKRSKALPEKARMAKIVASTEKSRMAKIEAAKEKARMEKIEASINASYEEGYVPPMVPKLVK